MNVKKIVEDAISQYSRGNYSVALEMYKKTLKKAMPYDLGAIYYNIGLCHFSMFKYKAAEVSFTKAFNDYNYKMCGYELCMSKLFNGDLQGGMELYKYRYYGERNTFPNLPLHRVMSAEDCKDKRVLVLNEQGFGDEIMFSRCILFLSNKATSVKYQVYDKMLNLFNDKLGSFENVKYFTDRTLSIEFINEFDCWTTTGDLFSSHLHQHNMDYQPLLSTNDKVRLSLEIGITWAANTLSGSSKLRTINIDILKEALIGDNTNITSLQFGECENWMVEKDISDFKKTFDVISMLDMVVTVDTVTAHLSGMMNKHTVLVYDTYLDWRWVYKLYKNVHIVHISDLKEYMITFRNEY